MKIILQAFRLIVVSSLFFGLVYTSTLTGLGQLFFPSQASGSLVLTKNQIVGSELLAQNFTSPEYFHPRPSAAQFATVASGASNLGPTSKALKEQVEKRLLDLKTENPAAAAEKSVPAELLFASGSGLDPHLSLEAVRFQIARVSKARGFSAEKTDRLEALIEKSAESSLFGPTVVNVLLLNLKLDELG